MLELSYLLGWLAVALLLFAVTISFKPGSGSLLQRLNGLIATENKDIENVSRLLVGAVFLSATAAILAILRWMFA
jgi:hypothetical protein